MSLVALEGRRTVEAYRHEALFYAGIDQFVTRMLPFIKEGVALKEPTLVVVSAAKIDRLRAKLKRDADGVEFRDMAEVGANPARIIPAWVDFVSQHSQEGRRVRGIGEPIAAGQDATQLVERQRHEALLNVAFDQAPAWWLLCPYDTTTLDPTVLREAERTHPFIARGRQHGDSTTYQSGDASAPFDVSLPEPEGPVAELGFNSHSLSSVRGFVTRHAVRSGLKVERTGDLLLAVNEVATNSIRHGDGGGALRLWVEKDALVCEIFDGGHVDQPLVGRIRPGSTTDGSRGLWLANQLCDLVQIRSFPNGTVVRLRMRLT